jgi:hypothetical protein
MAIIGFRKRHGKGTTGIAYLLSPTHLLGFVYMPQRSIGKLPWEAIRGNRFQSTHDYPFATVVVRQFGTQHMQMPHGNQWKLRTCLFLGKLIQAAVHPFHTGHIRILILLICRRIIALS